jgi:hypothetical protein
MELLSLMQRVRAGRNTSTAAPEEKDKVDISQATFRRYKRTYKGITGAWTWAEWAKGKIRMPMGRSRATQLLGARTRRRNRMRDFYVGVGTPGAEAREATLCDLHERLRWGCSAAEWERCPNLRTTAS